MGRAATTGRRSTGKSDGKEKLLWGSVHLPRAIEGDAVLAALWVVVPIFIGAPKTAWHQSFV